MSKKIYDIAVLGGGASGLAAAYKASINNKNVILLEGNKKLGKKLLATGNGRCNISNSNMDLSHYHGDAKLIKELLDEYTPDSIKSFFKDLGVLSFEDNEGRIYPLNLQAQAVNDALIRAVTNEGCEILLEYRVNSITKEKDVFLIKSRENAEIKAKKLIIAMGGMAAPKLSSDTNGYDLMGKLGHKIKRLTPSLVQFISKDKFIQSLSGVRAKGEVSLVIGDKELRKEKGEIQFNDKSLSGICVMQLSLECAKFLNDNFEFSEKAYLKLDLLPEINFNDLFSIIKDTSKIVKDIKNTDLLSGILNIKIAKQIIKTLNLDPDSFSRNLKDTEIKSIVSLIKNLKISISGTKGFDDAQVTSGGVILKDINLSTMESKLCKNLYFAGEILNINGDCGGYNLHFAFLTGIKAGINASKN